MSIGVGKFFTAWLTPPGAMLLLVALGLMTKRKWLAWVGLALLWAAATPWLVQRAANAYQAPVAMLPMAQIAKADVIVILGGALSPDDSSLGYNYSAAADRVAMGAALYHAQKAPMVLFSGGPAHNSESVPAARALALMAVPARAMLIEPASRTTRENATETLPMLRQRGMHRILLVTSRWHMSRAQNNFADAAHVLGWPLEIIPAAADDLDTGTQGDWRDFLPNADALVASRSLGKEALGQLWRAVGGR